ncbi:bacillithiol system redox-active protein YtxJ [Tenacibaculum maritimum]|uniref:bacillithiol system redox-active protein YtxJ n=1 Tax=Tenacibaculum maritimum TaxID=107401 RepID=UPI0012E67DA6|nr:bacillithiol system redox-active protein YtxJ [Tenacibaculum maritimum]MCD9580455.1 bacillithiol system redox-active protein YtxJ [Tenacibaculum maritimum]MCD9635390.1 bacillithiol system redox-active protein YtxJ [Tenacibaculum maritimum]CAA0180051.1 Protein of unknown function YtxJ [Tenacibaculum maritimum]CAA0183408.1 Protein of unknown function YtxJ [Tenacibaculum maritimum]CAA0227780.1 Protein of unknown function YtxJ [Tenacibaculum maritimum]
MGLFSSIFGNKTKKEDKKEVQSNVNWIRLNSLKQLEAIKKLSKTETVAIFKHSTRCSISSVAIQRFERSFDEDLKELKVYYLDLLNYREISNEVGYQFQVLHQSPQLLVIKNGEAVAHASHYDIAQVNLKSFLK